MTQPDKAVTGVESPVIKQWLKRDAHLVEQILSDEIRFYERADYEYSQGHPEETDMAQGVQDEGQVIH